MLLFGLKRDISQRRCALVKYQDCNTYGLPGDISYRRSPYLVVCGHRSPVFLECLHIGARTLVAKSTPSHNFFTRFLLHKLGHGAECLEFLKLQRVSSISLYQNGTE